MRFGQRALDIIADDKIRSAIEQGEFDSLPGLGKPHPIIDEPYDPMWWIRRKLAAESMSPVTPKPVAPKQRQHDQS